MPKITVTEFLKCFHENPDVVAKDLYESIPLGPDGLRKEEDLIHLLEGLVQIKFEECDPSKVPSKFWLAACKAMILKVICETFPSQTSLITREESATALYWLTKLYSSYGDLPEPFPLNKFIVDSLVQIIFYHPADAKPKDLSTALWAITKLIEAEKLLSFNKEQLDALITLFYEKRKDASHQDVAMTLWAIAKLFIAEKISIVNQDQLKDLVIQYHWDLPCSTDQSRANFLWAIGIITASLKINKCFLKPLINESLATDLLKIIAARLKSTEQPNPKEKQQILQGISLLGLKAKASKLGIDGPKLTDECRPQYDNWYHKIMEHIPSDKANWELKIEQEVCIDGFFIDALVQLKSRETSQVVNLVLEFDGIIHERESKKTIDTFKDKYLSTTRPDLLITRVKLGRCTSTFFKDPDSLSFPNSESPVSTPKSPSY